MNRWVTLLFCWLATSGRAQDPVTGPARSKKGLQVQMVEDALELGIAHAALNLSLGHLLREVTADRPLLANLGEVEVAPGWGIDAGALARLDASVRPLASAEVELSFILLARATGRAELDRLLLDPRYDPEAPNRLGAMRVLDDEGRRIWQALIGALGRRYGHGSSIGLVRGWIVGNEVNSHWWWYNLGCAELEEVVEVYEPAVRLVHAAVAPSQPSARVFISLEHHWQRPFSSDASRSCRGRELLDRFAEVARQRGDFPWHVAYHPYPENLFDCRFWEDESALPSEDTPRITFRNLEVLTTYLERQELLWEGRPRRVILSEQGFHCPEGEAGERLQAAAFARAWNKVESLSGIDAFIYHRHVDHAHEGGLRFGLWTREPNSVADPQRRRPLWELFRVCDTEVGAEALTEAIRVADG